ncbi:hypothetical protein Tdes44962_MAKER09785 [Teratosphaeria destructans]|uniref:Uncharacterized protein n=1 Tax=Teratosphaeria destructans TaxID=418781 RepID=A0A9W7SRK0_9PEZI|nr:hypothetical protein Tdes44962_MAKER09785 [Teratosphaeria destructans]
MAGLRQNQGLAPTISGGNGEYQIPAQDCGGEWNGGVGAAAAEEAGGATEQQRVGFGMRKFLKRRAVGAGKAQ